MVQLLNSVTTYYESQTAIAKASQTKNNDSLIEYFKRSVDGLTVLRDTINGAIIAAYPEDAAHDEALCEGAEAALP